MYNNIGAKNEGELRGYFRPNSSLEELQNCANLLTKVLYYGQTGNYSSKDIQDAVYWIVSAANQSNPSGGNSLTAQAMSGSMPTGVKLNVYLPVPAEFQLGGGYQIGGWDQALIRLEQEIDISTAAYVNGNNTSSPVVVSIPAGETSVSNITIEDKITYSGLASNQEYVVQSRLYNVNGNIVAKSWYQKRTADASGAGTWDAPGIPVKANSGIEQGVESLSEGTYYLYVDISSVDSNNNYNTVAYHDGKNDAAEQIKVTKETTTVNPVDVNFQLTKALTGKTLEANMFEFKLTTTASDEVVSLKNDSRWTSAKDSEKAGALNNPLTATIKKAGTYTFTIEENTGYIKSGLSAADYEGISYAPSKTFTVTVAENSGALSVTGVTGDGVTNDGNNVNVGTFTNKYEESQEYIAETSISVKKELKGGNISDYTGDNAFEFSIEADSAVDAEGNTISEIPLPENTTAKNDAAGKVNFGTVKFKVPGVYKYKVKEIIPDNQGELEYSTEEKIVTVNVSAKNAAGGE